MKKNVESVKMSRYEAYKQFGEISKDEDDIEYVIRQKFDKDGFLIENIHYNRYGEETYECFLTYEDGYLSEFAEVHHQRYGKNEIKGKRVELSNNYACWEYDGYDYKSTVTSFDNTMVNGCYHQIMQNENGTMVSEKYIRKDGMELIIRRFDNESNLRLEEINELDDNDLMIEKMQVFHNSGEEYPLMLKYE